mmetsp:Transcript_18707/g.56604  ORF Transcript_18707/g.56604 Transcript_18707/m.56604 type:complete len:479 (-) Transcript_18707:221-1657(-)
MEPNVRKMDCRSGSPLLPTMEAEMTSPSAEPRGRGNCPRSAASLKRCSISAVVLSERLAAQASIIMPRTRDATSACTICTARPRGMPRSLAKPATNCWGLRPARRPPSVFSRLDFIASVTPARKMLSLPASVLGFTVMPAAWQASLSSTMASMGYAWPLIFASCSCFSSCFATCVPCSFWLGCTYMGARGSIHQSGSVFMLAAARRRLPATDTTWVPDRVKLRSGSFSSRCFGCCLGALLARAGSSGTKTSRPPIERSDTHLPPSFFFPPPLAFMSMLQNLGNNHHTRHRVPTIAAKDPAASREELDRICRGIRWSTEYETLSSEPTALLMRRPYFCALLTAGCTASLTVSLSAVNCDERSPGSVGSAFFSSTFSTTGCCQTGAACTGSSISSKSCSMRGNRLKWRRGSHNPRPAACAACPGAASEVTTIARVDALRMMGNKCGGSAGNDCSSGFLPAPAGCRALHDTAARSCVKPPK